MSIPFQRFGCVCNSTLVKFNTTTTKLYNKNKGIYGVYKYAGMQNGKPYYERQDSVLYPPRPMGTARPSYSSGQRSTSSGGRRCQIDMIEHYNRS